MVIISIIITNIIKITRLLLIYKYIITFYNINITDILKRNIKKNS